MDAPAETPPARKNYNFTRENAREMQRRGMETKRQRRKELLEREERYFALTAETPENYAKVRLSRTRAQIERLDEQMEKEHDPKNLKFLADSLYRLHELESKLRAPVPQGPASKRGNQASGPLD